MNSPKLNFNVPSLPTGVKAATILSGTASAVSTVAIFILLVLYPQMGTLPFTGLMTAEGVTFILFMASLYVLGKRENEGLAKMLHQASQNNNRAPEFSIDKEDESIQENSDNGNKGKEKKYEEPPPKDQVESSTPNENDEIFQHTDSGTGEIEIEQNSDKSTHNYHDTNDLNHEMETKGEEGEATQENSDNDNNEIDNKEIDNKGKEEKNEPPPNVFQHTDSQTNSQTKTPPAGTEESGIEQNRKIRPSFPNRNELNSDKDNNKTDDKEIEEKYTKSPTGVKSFKNEDEDGWTDINSSESTECKIVQVNPFAALLRQRLEGVDTKLTRLLKLFPTEMLTSFDCKDDGDFTATFSKAPKGKGIVAWGNGYIGFELHFPSKIKGKIIPKDKNGQSKIEITYEYNWLGGIDGESVQGVIGSISANLHSITILPPKTEKPSEGITDKSRLLFQASRFGAKFHEEIDISKVDDVSLIWNV